MARAGQRMGAVWLWQLMPQELCDWDGPSEMPRLELKDWAFILHMWATLGKGWDLVRWLPPAVFEHAQ